MVDIKKDLETKYEKIISRVSRKIPMSDDSFVYSVLLFREVLQKIEETKERYKAKEKLSYEEKFLLCRLKKQPELFSSVDLIFRVCIYLAYKVIEDEFTLFVKDYSGVVGADQEDLEELEIFIVADVMNF
jgi:hypothetical protein